MKIKTNEVDKKVVIELSGEDYFLKELSEEEVKRYYVDQGDYALVHRIDMSYCGKAPQEGCLFMTLSREEADRLKYIFDEIV